MTDTREADDRRLRDIVTACASIEGLMSAEDVDVEAVRAGLRTIGEVVRTVDPAVLALEPGVSWADAARMGRLLADEYFDSGHPMILATARTDAPTLRAAAERLLRRNATTRSSEV